jgi:nucleoside-diphosphate-sugar epimerase
VHHNTIKDAQARLAVLEFTFVTDQIEGLLRLASLDAARGQVVNIGNTSEITVLVLAKKSD